MKKRITIFAIAIMSFVCGYSQTSPKAESSVVTDTVIFTNSNSVTLYATITNVCSCTSSVNIGFRLLTMTDPNVPYVVNVDCPVAYEQSMTSFMFDTNDLIPQTNYAYMAYIEDEEGLHYGEVKTFSTGTSGLIDMTNNKPVISLYPNPAKEETTLSFSSLLSKTKLIVVDLQGKVVNTIELQPQTNTYSLNTSNLNSGIYYIIIQNDQFITTKKFIKQ
jgi:hypothetical protein